MERQDERPKTKDQGTQAYAWWLMHNKATQTGQDISYGPEPRPALRTLTPVFYLPATKGKYAAGTATQVRPQRKHQRVQTARYLEWPACLYLLPTPPATAKGTVVEASTSASTSTPQDEAMSTKTISPTPWREGEADEEEEAAAAAPKSLGQPGRSEPCGHSLLRDKATFTPLFLSEEPFPTGRILHATPAVSGRSKMLALLEKVQKLPGRSHPGPPAEPAGPEVIDEPIEIPDLDPADPLGLTKDHDDDPDIPLQ